MSTNESHKIDELFREELSNYAVPVTVTAVPLLAVAAKKGLFYKIAALLKVNTFTLVAGTATVTSVATVATVKIVEHYQKKNEVVVQQNQIEQNANTSTQQQFVDTLQQQISNTTEIAPIVDVKVQKVEAQNQAIKTETADNSKISEKVKGKASQTQSISTVQQTQTQTPNPISTATTQTEKVIPTSTDSAQNTVAPVRKVVYVKQKPVVVQDTVVKVIKKVRPKKE